jgi:hypothetical protein
MARARAARAAKALADGDLKHALGRAIQENPSPLVGTSWFSSIAIVAVVVKGSRDVGFLGEEGPDGARLETYALSDPDMWQSL